MRCVTDYSDNGFLALISMLVLALIFKKISFIYMGLISQTRGSVKYKIFILSSISYSYFIVIDISVRKEQSLFDL